MEPFKNAISPAVVNLLATHIESAYPAFGRVRFAASVLAELEQLELKARVDLIADTLLCHLPADTEHRSRILQAVLHPEEGNSPEQASDESGMRGFAIWPLSIVAGKYGLDNLDATLAALKEMTKRFSAEFGIRYPLIHDQAHVLSVLEAWLEDPHPSVRRLVSEGTRPRLPWAQQLPRLIADPSPTLPLLERLRDDPSDYVRRSVANHLNDISKDHPALVVDLSRGWIQGADSNRRKLLRHACRSLIKSGDPDALAVFGHAPPKLRVGGFQVSPVKIALGESLALNATLISESTESQSLVVDYVAKFLKANGAHGEKVFKGATVRLPAGGEVVFKRNLAVKPITTRRYYPGPQYICLRINGRDFGKAAFDLVIP